MTTKKTKTKPKRVLVWVEGGCAYASADPGVEWELLDWDNIKAGDSWTPEQIDAFEKWGAGLVGAGCLKRLREYAAANKEKDKR